MSDGGDPTGETDTDADGDGDADGDTDADRCPEVILPRASLAPFRRLSLYNSPYPAHDRGHAVDLYPDSNEGVSPVAGEVLATRTVRTPRKPYAAARDHLILVAADGEWCAAAGLGGGVVARVLHVDPAVEPGDHVAVGDSLGEMVRSGFFAPWVDNHVHLGFRTPEQNLHRASGSLPLSLPSAPTPLRWDGTGTVVDGGETFVVLDEPTHPGRDVGWCGLGVDSGAGGETDGVGGVLDGGFPHYGGGGLVGGATPPPGVTAEPEAVSLLGTVVGDRRGRTVQWREVTVEANGRPVTGLSLFLARDGPAGVKVVCPDHGFERDEEVTVAVVAESTTPP